MMYTLELYKNMSENSDVQKKLTDKITLSGIARAAIDILKPIIDVQGIPANEYNYCYVKELKRYYYIENTIVDPNGVCRLTMRVDVLMTYIEDIRASSGLIMKQREYNPYFGEYDIDARMTLQKYVFEDKFNKTGEFILVALRG